MSIPLDRLYHYIESVAQEVHGNTVIYRFDPHGSKKLEDLSCLHNYSYSSVNNYNYIVTNPQILCYDQEPLSFDSYRSIDLHCAFPNIYSKEYADSLTELGISWVDYNLRCIPGAPINIYDQCILLHSEQRSKNVIQYEQSGFVPVYYWNHALLALDWYRYAYHQTFTKHQKRRQFLIYNRAWSGTREYRLKFADLLVDNQLLNYCQTSVGFTSDGLNYKDHQFTNPIWQPIHQLEYYFNNNFTTSCCSADFNVTDYNSTDIEVVLETLVDDDRIHLTEKILRPIACGQPFILCATYGSLEYLRNYGFQTFDSIFDESYDMITDPFERLNAIVKLMKKITQWSDSERSNNLIKLRRIADYNRQHFFSNNFFNRITNELRKNLKTGLTLIENTNTSQRFINERKLQSTNLSIKNTITSNRPERTRTDTTFIMSKARTYYNRYLKSLNK